MSKRKALIIEDEKAIAEPLAIALQAMDYEVECLTDATEALGHIPEGRWDVVVLDVMMPIDDSVQFPPDIQPGRATGVLLARELYKYHPTLPIVVSTVVRDTAIRKQLHKEGVRWISNKPAPIDEIVDAVKRAVPPVQA